MAHLTKADLNEFPSMYTSPRGLGGVLVSEDAARLIIETSSSGDDTALQSLLSQPKWIKAMFEKPHTTYYEDRQSQGPDELRPVTAMPMSNLERALTIAAGNAGVVSTLLTFATLQGLKPSDVMKMWAVSKAMDGGNAAVFRALVSADPNVLNFQLGHGSIELGADPLHPVEQMQKLSGYNSSLLSLAAMAGPRMTMMLLEHGVPIPHTGALHTAARFGHLVTMRLLMEYGADLNETIPNWSNWTPMHFAASRGEVDAMKLLEHSGARSDLKDEDGKTPAQLLEERDAAENSTSR